MRLLTSQNPKLQKSRMLGYYTVGLHLAPFNLANPAVNLCKHSTKSCRSTCLFYSGHGSMSKIMESRIELTKFFLTEQERFMRELECEIFYYKKKAHLDNLKLAVRLNTTSDVDFQDIMFYSGNTFTTIFNCFPDVTFYDYTKDFCRVSCYDNYDLTYSFDKAKIREMVKIEYEDSTYFNNKRLAAVFYGKSADIKNYIKSSKLLIKQAYEENNASKALSLINVPKKESKLFQDSSIYFKDRPVINGDVTDLTFLNPNNSLVVLSYKNVIIKDFNNLENIQTSSLVFNI